MSKRSYRSNGKGKRKKAPASNPELADIPAGLSPTGEVAPRQAGLSSTGEVAPCQAGLSPTGEVAPRQPGLSPTGEVVPRQPGLPPMEEVRRPAHGKRRNPPQSVNGRAPRFERCVGQAPPEDGELTDVSGDGNGESLPPSVDGRRGDLSAPGGPLKNPLVRLVTCHLLPHLPYHLRRESTGRWEVLWLYQVIPRRLHHLQGLTRRWFDL